MDYKPPRDLFLSLLLVVMVACAFAIVFFAIYGILSLLGVGLLDYASAVFAISFVSFMGWVMARALRSQIGRH